MRNNYNNLLWSYLVAYPSMIDPFFEESVLLLLDDSENGSFGIVLNKPLNKKIKDIDNSLPQIGDISLYEGGPLEKSKLSLALWKDSYTDEPSKFSFGITPEKLISMMKEDPELKAMAFLGYSSWTKGQLHSEIESETWSVLDVDLSVLNKEASEIWRILALKVKPVFKFLPEPKKSSETRN